MGYHAVQLLVMLANLALIKEQDYAQIFRILPFTCTLILSWSVVLEELN